MAKKKDADAPVLEVRHLTKEYPTPRGPLRVLEDVHLTLEPGQSVSIMGPSGSGKSSLLYILGTLEPPSSGQVTLDGQDPFTLDEPALARYRNRQIGFVFQDHCLLPQCSVMENVLIPTLAGADGEEAATMARARELLDAVGLGDRLEHRPAELSGGEKQRVAIARALIRNPRLVLCDEPTGNLDRDSAGAVASLLLELHRERQSVLITVTHSQRLAERFPRRFEIVDRRLEQAT